MSQKSIERMRLKIFLEDYCSDLNVKKKVTLSYMLHIPFSLSEKKDPEPCSLQKATVKLKPPDQQVLN